MSGADDFASDPWAWDLETGRPGVKLFAQSVQVYSGMRELAGDNVTVRDVAVAFRCSDDMVRRAVQLHPLMLLSVQDAPATEQVIEHDGE